MEGHNDRVKRGVDEGVFLPGDSIKSNQTQGGAHMTQYILTYLGGNPPSSPEEGQQHFAKYRE